jgi:hypothetical protein
MNQAHRSSRAHFIAVAALLGAIGCAGCSSPGRVHADSAAVDASANAAPVHKATTTNAETELRRGIRSYEDAEYAAAARQLRSAVGRGLRASEDKVMAYKYLAFLACSSGRTTACHGEFRNALRVDPTFELAPAEAGHPIWGPVFRKAKLEVNGKARTRQPQTDYASR